MSTKAFFAAIGLIVTLLLFAFSLWAEWGPYAWTAAIQVAIGGSYYGLVAYMATFIIFCVPTIFLGKVVMASGRWAFLLAFGVPAALVAVHLSLTVYYLVTGGVQVDSSTFSSAVREAGFLPRNIELDARKLAALDTEHASHLRKRRSSSKDEGDVYIPFVSSVWLDDGTPVVFKSKSDSLKQLASGKPVKGMIRKMPLPYLVRRSLPDSKSTCAVIIESSSSVRFYWGLAVAFYILGGLILLRGMKS
jgi:hypothetical protein